MGPGHGVIGGGILQQPGRFAHDVGTGRADQAGSTGIHGFRALGGAAQHQHRFAQGGRLLLQAAGIGQQQGAAPHRRHQLVVIEGLGEEGAGMVAE